ncbi:hypothetical protein EDD18DRAFT_1147805 [Armillaria luteobubalina]|uniref:F-box domain-containing protein n=1 Tax=Armillaria luteobubalina TaxID=153913 RepID=A0AA39URM4_9AGAR|nr:hypothetical protein EDD18DRAFT_1147805 [Armillaria luteobubalina]
MENGFIQQTFPQCGFCSSPGPGLPSISVPAGRVNQLLASNEPPSDYELDDFKKILSSGSEHLHSLSQRLSQVRDLLNQLTAHSIAVENQLLISKTLTNPVRKVPCEVLEQIFSWGMVDPMNATIDSPDNSLDARDFLWTVSQVCSTWRVLTLSRPRWWASIRLDLQAPVPEERGLGPLQRFLHRTTPQALRNQYVELVGPSLRPFIEYRFALHLERSGEHTLSIYMGSKRDISAHPLLPLILSSSPRWGKLRVSFYKPESFCALEAVSDSLDSLHELRVAVFDDHKFPSSWNTTTFRNAPKLQTVTLNDRPDFFQLPWSQILNADICGKVMQILPEFENATALTLRPTKRRLSATATFSSSHLTRLSLWESHHAVPEGTIEFCFSLMSLPKLLSLELHYHGRCAKLPYFSLRTLPSLTSLLISAPSKCLDWSNTCEILHFLPNLESLSVEATINSDALFHTLISDQPSLRRLDLTGSDMSFDHKKLLNMLDGRRSERQAVLTELILPVPLMIVDTEVWRWSSIWTSAVTGGLNVVCRSHRSTIYIIQDEIPDVSNAPSTSRLQSS